MLASLTIALFLTACSSSSTPPPPQMPSWDAVPPEVVGSLCRRLQMDAIATGTTTLVKVTQPLVTRENLVALAGSTTKRDRNAPLDEFLSNRAIPVEPGSGNCSWRLIDAHDPRLPDEMVVELSAPLPNPYTRREAGLFARVSLGSEHQSWYWISLVPNGPSWSVRFVSVLFK